MPIYICKICTSEVQEGTIPAKCPNCSSSGENNWDLKPVPLLILYAPSHKFVIFEDKKRFSKENFYMFDKNEYQYVSKEQFTVQQNDDGWGIIASPSAVNPTLLNGVKLDSTVHALKAADTIRVGPISLTVQFKKEEIIGE